MPIEIWNTVLSIGLISIVGSVAWLWRTVIDCTQRMAKLKGELDGRDTPGTLASVDKQVKAVARDTNKMSGKVEHMESQLNAIQGALMAKD